MALLLLPLSIAAGLVSLICWIMVLIKMFQDSVVQGIVGLICGLWALIWGWQHKDDDLEKVMPIWTVAIVVGIAIRAVAIAAR